LGRKASDLETRKRQLYGRLSGVQQQIDYWAAEKYGNARGARTGAEQDVAKMRGLSVDALRKKRDRFRARRRKREAVLEQQSQAPAEKSRTLFAKRCP
jgi:hypothetical protein